MGRNVEVITSCDSSTYCTQVLNNNMELLRQQDKSVRLAEIQELEDLIKIKKAMLGYDKRADLADEMAKICRSSMAIAEKEIPWVCQLKELLFRVQTLKNALVNKLIDRQAPDVAEQYQVIIARVTEIDADIRQHDYLWEWRDIYSEYSVVAQKVMQEIRDLHSVIVGGV